MNVSFHPAARDEFIAAAEYYDRAVPGLGDRFLVAVRRTIAFAVEQPEAGSIRTVDTRRLLVHGFPYDLIYRVHEQEQVDRPTGVSAGFPVGAYAFTGFSGDRQLPGLHRSRSS